MDEALAAAQRFETYRKVVDKGTARVLSAGLHDESTTKHLSAKVGEQAELIAGVQTGICAQEQPGLAKQLFNQQAEILDPLNSLQQPGEQS